MARMGMNISKFQRSEKLLPIYSPRTAYKKILESDDRLLSDITLNFDKFTINLMKNEFKNRNWEIRLPDFISIVKQHLVNWQVDLPNRSYRMVRCLTNLFEEIDINGNGILEWEEFTNYIIQKATILKNLRTKNEQVKSYTKVPLKHQVKMDNSIPKTVYIQDLNKLAIFEQGTNVIHLMDPETGECLNKPLSLTPKQLVVNMSMVKKDKDGRVQIKKKELIVPTGVRVLDILYIPEEKYRLLVTATSDGFVRGWRYSSGVGFTLATQPDNEEEFVEHQFSQQIYCMAWDGLNEILFCSQKDGSISLWNLKTDIERPLYDPLRKDIEDEVHTMMVMDMITVPKLHFMASAGMDGKVILWDTINNRVKWVYKEHTRGVLSVSYNEELILLFSAGFDHKICIWNPYISTIIHKIEAHSSPVLCVRAISSTYQIVSLDSQGIVKVHDIRRFNFLSSFSADGHDENLKLSPTNFAVINKPLKLCFVGRSVSVFEYDKNYNPVCVDDVPALSCQYLKSNLRFYTPCGNKIKVWSALTGEIDYVFMDVTEAEITTFCVDRKQKCMAIGDVLGNIVLVNITNGAKLRNLPGHAGEVTQILTTLQGEFNIFMTVGVDNVINIIRETPEGYELARSLNIRKDTSISCMSYCPVSKYIIVGTSMGVIGFYELDTGKLVGSVSDQNLDEVTSVSRMDSDAVITTSSIGCISVVTMPPRMSKFQKILSISHIDPQKTGPPTQLGIVSSVYSNTLKRLFVVDDKMFMSCYNFESLQTSMFTGTATATDEMSPTHSCLRRKAHKLEKFANFRLERDWVVRTHNEPVKSMQFIEAENILATTAFDKRVKLWKAETGEYIDSLQQNYERKQPQVLAYLKPLSKQLYKSTFSKAPIPVPNANIHPEFDPFCCFQLESICDVKPTKSHPDWKLEIDFKSNYQAKEKQFKSILDQAKQFSSEMTKTSLQDRMKKGILSMHTSPVVDAERGKAMLRQLAEKRKEGKKEKDKPKERSSYIDSQDMTPKIVQKISIRALAPTGDFISQLKKIKSKQELSRDRENHKAYIDNLHRQEIQSKIISKNDAKIVLSKQQADAAIKLSKALYNADRTDRRPLSIMNSIVVKDDKLPRL